jgi:Tfp pilus assembly protein PilF
VTLVSGVPPRAAPTRSNEAYALYLQARALARSAGEGDAAAAQQTLRRALALDPQFATAWAELAHSYTAEFGWHDGIDHASACAQAHEAADRALALAPALADAHRAKAIVLTECQGSPAAAEAELKQALALDPGDAAVWHAYAAHANSQGRFAEGLRLAQESIARDPLNAWNYYPLAIAQSNLGRPAEAEATYRRMVEIAPTAAGVHALHANSLLGVNRPGEALAEAERESDEQFRDMDLPLIYDALGRRAEAERAIDEFIRKYGQRDTFTPAEFYACRHDADRALPWLRRAYGDGIAPDADLPNRMACLQGIEHDPRYQELVRRAPPKIHFP